MASAPSVAIPLSAASPPAQPLQASPTPHHDFLDETERLINLERQGQGLPPLTATAPLRLAAGRHAEDMAVMELCTHTGSDGSRPGQRMLAAGVPVPYGEIVACGFADPPSVVAAWMNSPGHRDIILCSTCAELGAGYHWDPDAFQHYWVVNFAYPAPTAVPTTRPSPSPTAGPTATDLPFLRGDTSCDLRVNVVDAQFVLQYDVGLRQPASRCPLPSGSLRLNTCDMDQSGSCDTVDALWLLRCSAGEEHPQCGEAQAAPARRLRHPTLDRFASRRLGLAADSLLAVGVHPISPGLTVAVPMTLSVTAGLTVGALSGELRYDPHVARATACTLAPGLFGTCNVAFDADGIGTDVVRFSAISLSGLTGTQSLIQVSFLGRTGLPTSPSSGNLSPYVDVLADPDGKPLSADLQAGALIWIGPTATPPGAATSSPTTNPTPSATPSRTATPTPTATATTTSTATSTSTPSRTATSTPSATPSPSHTPSTTASATASPTPSTIPSATRTATATPSLAPTASSTASPTSTGTVIPTSPAEGGAPPACVSGEVFHDQGDDGRQHLPAPDYPLSGVRVELLLDSDGSGTLDPGDGVVTALLSDGLGAFRLCATEPGTYFLRLPAEEFAPDAILAAYRSSHGNDSAGRPPGPMDGVDGDDNGRDLPGGGVATLPLNLTGSGTAAGSVDLGLALEPLPTGLWLRTADAWSSSEGVLLRWSLQRDARLGAIQVEHRLGTEPWRRLTTQVLAPERGSWLHRRAPQPTSRYRLLGIDDQGRSLILAILKPRIPSRLLLPALRASGGSASPRR